MSWKELKQEGNYFTRLANGDIGSQLYKDHLIIFEGNQMDCWNISIFS